MLAILTRKKVHEKLLGEKKLSQILEVLELYSSIVES